MNLSGYQLNTELYNGSRTVVYRGQREADSLPVVIKFLKNPYPSFSEVLQFRNQYTISKNLHSPLIVPIYTLEPYQNSYALVMEDFGGISLRDYFRVGEKLSADSLPEFLQIAIAVGNALDVLYQNRIIHKDIKPSNILINPITKQVKLIDFSIASLLPRETQTPIHPNVLEGTLAYISPEQTGRMNRGIDYRTDLYSLGVTFFELLTGELSFASNDAMKLVHCHLAKFPPLVHEINPQIPPVFSEIVSKLMAKNAEDRYQSALGLNFDLEKCLTQLKETGEIRNFEIASRDVCDRFIIPDQLYGRDTEIKTLLEAFDRVSQGATEIILVAGFSGIGKTAVINEVHKPIVRQQGYFIKGKYDQFNRNIPFSAFLQAFRDLMGQLLSESDEQLQTWKTKILAAVGDNGQVLINVIPELENIIGKQPPATELSGSAAQNRFNLLLPKFVQVFTSKEHPLVMFLDDLQWSDSASLNLLKLLMQDTEYLLILGTYRDNEVSPVHPFMLKVDEIVKTGATVKTITLTPLGKSEVNQLVADTLNCELSIAQPLSKLVYQKAQGNPFFATQFLKALHDDKLISFNWDIQHWQCDLAQVKALAITDDVVEFMALRLEKLSIETQEILKLAACIGAEFDLNTLVIVSEKSAEKTATALWKALQEGLIIPKTKVYKFFTQSDSDRVFKASANPTYRFLHDRVQQAAYSLIPETWRQATHFQIGKLLLANVSPEEQGSKIFAIVNHLNEGFELHQSHEERSELLHLNCIAGRRAKESTAYGVAVNYFTVAEHLLPPDSWQQCYEKSLDVYFNLAEVKYLSGDFHSSLAIIKAISSFARRQIERAEAFNLAILMFTLQGQYLQALHYGQKALSCLNFDLSEIDLPEKLESYQREIQLKLANRQPEQLVDEPEATDPEKCLIIKILNNLIVPVYVLQKGELYFFVALSMVSVSLNFGVIAESGNGFSAYGMYLGYYQSDYQSGYEYGVLAESLAKRFRQADNLCKACYMLGNNLLSWVRPLRCSMPIFDEGLVAGLESGEMVYSGNLLMYKLLNSFYAGDSVLEVQQNLPEYLEFSAKKLNYQLAVDVISGLNIWLAELTASPAEDIPTEQQHLEACRINNSDYAICHYLLLKTKILCFYGRYEEAVESSRGAEYLVGTITGKYQVAAINFYQSIALAEYCRTHSLGLDNNSYIQKVKSNQVQLSLWVASCPENFAHKYDLVNAVLSVLSGQKTEAIELFDRAICGAKENDYIQEEALANELAAKFYLDWGKQRIAQEYMIEAYYGYARWDAKAKVADLEKRYPQLLAPILQQSCSLISNNETIFPLGTVTSTSAAISGSTSFSDTLDLKAILKATQTLSGEIEMEKLLVSLLSIIIENGGADKCVFMLLRDDRLLIKGLITESSEPVVLQQIPVEESEEIPLKLIYKVQHNQQTVVLINASNDPSFANDPYIIRQQPLSILCSPILHQGKLLGILYLENNLAKGVFTSDRVEILNLLCAQAAISLENARLYQSSQESAQQLKRSLDDLQQAQLQIIQGEKMSALGNLVAGVAHEINNPVGFLGGNIQPALDYINDLFGLIDIVQEKHPQLHPEVQEEIEAIDLEYIREDLPKLVGSMREGVKRIADISTSLRTFSRADTNHPVACNIHDGIDSTIMILKHRLKANEHRPEIKVVKDYGNLSQIECYAGQLNQVFMNLLSNAIDAVEDSNRGRKFAEIANEITVKTELSEDKKQAIIRIKDNGSGMSAQVQSKIFDHLFTTKEVGKGTGLGLAIARQIVVEKHQGTIEVESTIGCGTEFCIRLPVSPYTDD
ncbi:trifunctional serine/threonine-protein kinase/ATP-binding protein/sensor histidine kinase [Kamptonema formosum]|uniref:trifunctional serine/threonine-protein kinase/ATP-binding protein/sensor histidine kinase n=1 Tax=Kamptonema formosum TaxID=331992 RepID=UPI00034CA0D7|nr:ATP-binding sensor histidine kinase [Kamptonema formosum]